MCGKQHAGWNTQITVSHTLVELHKKQMQILIHSTQRHRASFYFILCLKDVIWSEIDHTAFAHYANDEVVFTHYVTAVE